MNATDTLINNIEQNKEKWDYDTALKIALEWLNSHMDDYRFYEEIADIYMYQGNIDKAEEVIRYARELHPESSTGIYLEGCILAEKWDFQKALNILEKANLLFPNNAEILRNIWWSHVMIGSMQKWIAILHRAHNLSPHDETILQNLTTAIILNEEKNSPSDS